jgi:hypothetical protein
MLFKRISRPNVDLDTLLLRVGAHISDSIHSYEPIGNNLSKFNHEVWVLLNITVHLSYANIFVIPLLTSE